MSPLIVLTEKPWITESAKKCIEHRRRLMMPIAFKQAKHHLALGLKGR